jgi:hypothetical protein
MAAWQFFSSLLRWPPAGGGPPGQPQQQEQLFEERLTATPMCLGEEAGDCLEQPMTLSDLLQPTDASSFSSSEHDYNNNNNNTTSLGKLPPELVLRIMAGLDLPSICKLRLVCRAFNGLWGEGFLWRKLAFARWGPPPKQLIPRTEGGGLQNSSNNSSNLMSSSPSSSSGSPRRSELILGSPSLARRSGRRLGMSADGKRVGMPWNKGLDWHKYYIQRALLLKPGSLQWTYPQLGGTVPSPRYVQTASLVGNTIAIIGGKRDEESRLDEIFFLHFPSLKFSRPEIRGKVPPLARHTATVVGNKVFVFGGYAATYFHYLSVLDMDTMTWYEPQTSGQRPRHRSNHSACAVGTKVYIFGGSTDDDDGNYITLGDFFVLDTETMTWKELTQEDMEGDIPAPRAGHRMVTVRDKVFLFGGGVWGKNERSWRIKYNTTTIFDPETCTWYEPRVKGTLPDLCTFPSLFVVNVFLFACFGQSMKLNTVNSDLFMLDTVAMEWTHMQVPSKTRPLSRDMASGTVVGGQVFFMGGNCAGLLKEHNFCMLQLPPSSIWDQKNN